MNGWTLFVRLGDMSFRSFRVATILCHELWTERVYISKEIYKDELLTCGIVQRQTAELFITLEQ
jgi:hypothetical protein